MSRKPKPDPEVQTRFGIPHREWATPPVTGGRLPFDPIILTDQPCLQRRARYGEITAPVSVPTETRRTPLQPVRVYPYGVARDRLIQAAKRMGVPALIVKDAGEADVLVTLKSYYRDRQQAVMQAEQRGMPIFVLRANTVSQMEQFLSDLFNLSEVVPAAGELEMVKNQTQAAIAAVLNGERWVDLPPGPATVRGVYSTNWHAMPNWSRIRMVKNQEGM